MPPISITLMLFQKKLLLLLKMEMLKLTLILVKQLNSMEEVILITNSSGTAWLQSVQEVVFFQKPEATFITV